MHDIKIPSESSVNKVQITNISSTKTKYPVKFEISLFKTQLRMP